VFTEEGEMTTTDQSVRTASSYGDCTSRPDCKCRFCTHDRNLPSEEDTLAEEFMKQYQEKRMAKNHYSTKPKRRNKSGRRKDWAATTMAKLKQLANAAAGR
jgi:hypothetical protein